MFMIASSGDVVSVVSVDVEGVEKQRECKRGWIQVCMDLSKETVGHFRLCVFVIVKYGVSKVRKVAALAQFLRHRRNRSESRYFAACQSIKARNQSTFRAVPKFEPSDVWLWRARAKKL